MFLYVLVKSHGRVCVSVADPCALVDCGPKKICRNIAIPCLIPPCPVASECVPIDGELLCMMSNQQAMRGFIFVLSACRSLCQEEMSGWYVLQGCRLWQSRVWYVTSTCLSMSLLLNFCLTYSQAWYVSQFPWSHYNLRVSYWTKLSE